MRTDDTFQYAKAGKQLLLVLEALPGNPGGGGGGGVHASMGDAMMACLSVMESKYSFAWVSVKRDLISLQKRPTNTLPTGTRTAGHVHQRADQPP